MRGKIKLICVFLTFTFGLMACGGGTAPATTTSNAAKPGNTNTASNKASNTASNSASTKKSDKPALKDAKKPEGTAKTASKNVPVPENWIYIYDENKGYGFSVPEGSTGGSETQDGVDTFLAATPAPAEAAVIVISFKDKKMTKEDLLNVAVKFFEELGETVNAGKLTAESEDYSLTEAMMTSKDGAKSKAKILVGTDVTDNYVMIVGTDEAKFAANEEIIDAIWGSFEMRSGGSTGNN